MSNANRAKSNRQKQLDRLHRRLNSARPDLPILRTAERLRATPPSPTLPPGEVGQRPGEGEPTHPSSPSPLLTHDSPLPEWTTLLPLPANLPPTFRSFLYRYIEENHKPRNTHESYLAAQIAQAMARKHLSASREPADQPNSLWLRYETLADRQLKAAQRAWQTHQKARPPETQRPPAALPTPTQHSSLSTPPSPNTPPSPTPPQTPPILPNATFAHKNPDDMTTAEALDELNDILNQLDAHRRSTAR